MHKDKRNKSIKKAVDLLGSQQKLAKATNTAQSSVWKWLHNKSKVSLENVELIVFATNGAVTCEESRPDINWSVLRKNTDQSSYE